MVFAFEHVAAVPVVAPAVQIVSPAVQITTLIVSLLGTIVFPGVMAYLMERLKRSVNMRVNDVNHKVVSVIEKQDDASAKVNEVKTSLHKQKIVNKRINNARDQKLEDLAAVARATHTLVNGNTEALLRVIVTDKRRIAAASGDPVDAEAAATAAAMLDDHLSKKADVTAQPGTADQKAGRGAGGDPAASTYQPPAPRPE